MEDWVSDADVGLILKYDQCHQLKIDLIPKIPAFHRSNIPLFQDPMAFDYVNSAGGTYQAQLPARRVGPTARREDQLVGVGRNFVSTTARLSIMEE